MLPRGSDLGRHGVGYGMFRPVAVLYSASSRPPNWRFVEPPTVQAILPICSSIFGPMRLLSTTTNRKAASENTTL